jgi:hypothetical protein
MRLIIFEIDILNKLNLFKMNIDVMRYTLPEFLTYSDLINFSMMNKKTYDLMKNSLVSKRKRIVEKLKEMYPLIVLETFGINNLLFGENVIWNPKWLGATDYIDRVYIDELKNVFSYGIDEYQRPFIFYKSNNTLLVAFQRYTDATLFVVIDPDGDLRPIIKGRCSLNEEFSKDLREFIQTS